MKSSVLLVDDSAVQAATRRMILERAGYQVTVSLDANHALALLDERGCESAFSLVITDHIMPTLNGSEFVNALRDICETLPVLVLSGMPDAETLYEDLDVEFRLKPLAPDELLATIAKMVQQPPMFRTA